MHCRYSIAIVAFLCCSYFCTVINASSESSETKTSNHTAETGIKLAEWKFHHLQIHITLTLFIFAILIVKMVYDAFEVVASVIPESCVLIVIGLIFGAIIKYGLGIGKQNDLWELSPDLFLLILLPPIVLEAAHGLSQRAFTDIFGPVMLFAVVGTAVTFMIIGFALYGLNVAGAMGSGTPALSLLHCLLFGSLIVAVDPVAVLAIFEEIGVDKTLYFLVFGESLFNDAVTIVLYNMMVAFVTMKTVGTVDIILGIASFFTVSLGGTAIGLIFGVLSCLLTRISGHSRLIQPLILLSMAYMSYLAGDLVGWSGIISMIACGILQSTYAFHNMAQKSVSVTRRMLKIWAKISESIVFLFLGIAMTRGNLKWSTGLILWALALCLVVRFVITILLSVFLNKTNSIIKKISFTEQFIIGYGGLRGAVAFSLATMIKAEVFSESQFEKDHFVTATLFIIMFTIFPMGMTIKPLVRLLKIRLEKPKGLSLIDEISDNVMDHFTAGIEAISGHYGQHAIHEWIEHVDSKYIRPYLQNDPESPSQRIIDMYEKVALTLHYAAVDHNRQSTHYLDKLCPTLKEKFMHESESQPTITHYETAKQKGFVHGIGTIASILSEIDHHNDQPFERRPPRGPLLRSLSLNPEVTSDDYRSLLKSKMPRRNAVVLGSVTEHEDYLGRVHNAMKRKKDVISEVYKGRHNHELREMQTCTTSTATSVDGLAYTRLHAIDEDENRPVNTVVELPEVDVHKSPRFQVFDEREDDTRM